MKSSSPGLPPRETLARKILTKETNGGEIRLSVLHHGHYHPAGRKVTHTLCDSIPANGRQLARDDRPISRGKRSAIRMETGQHTGRSLPSPERLSTHRGVFPRRSRHSRIHRGNLATCTVASRRRSRSRSRVKPTVIPFSPWVIVASSFPEGGHRDCNMISCSATDRHTGGFDS